MPSIQVLLETPANGEFFTTTETFRGKVILHLDTACSVKEVNLKLKCFSETNRRYDNQVSAIIQNGILIPIPDVSEAHSVLDVKHRVFPPDNVWDAMQGNPKPFQLGAGKHEYDFEFKGIPHSPKCLTIHRPDIPSFITRNSHAHLPPTFNQDWLEMTKSSDPKISYYGLGKVIYTIGATATLGSDKQWFKSSNKEINCIQKIEMIPPAKDLYVRVRNGSENDTVAVPDLVSRPSLSQLTPSALTNATTFISPTQVATPISSAWLEVKSQRLQRTFRCDQLFRKGHNKLDNISLVFAGEQDINSLKHRIRPAKVKLNLLECVTYESQGTCNPNFSLLKLLEVHACRDLPIPLSAVLEFSKAEISSGMTTIPFKLYKHPCFYDFKFNEQDYRHRGNRLYSFTTCAIRREFKFQLVVTWLFDQVPIDIEVNIPAQIFIQPRERKSHTSRKAANTEPLPLYERPPDYTE